MSGGTNQALEGVIIDHGPVLYTAAEHQRLVNLTHGAVFLKRDPELAEAFAKASYDLIRQHLRLCHLALAHDPDAVEADIHSDSEHEATSVSI